jgi:Cytochrome oxidase complex assembly protein 1
MRRFLFSLACLHPRGRLLPGWLAMVLGLVIAAVGTSLLRPRLPEPGAVAAPLPTPGSGQRQPFFGKHWKRSLAITGGIATLGGLLWFLVIGNSEVSKLAFARAQESPAVKQHLGTPLRRGLLTSGSIEISGSSGHADLAVPISGPKGRAYPVRRGPEERRHMEL